MTSNIMQRSGSVTRYGHRRSRNWKQIERTVPEPGHWVQTRDRWEKVPAR